MAPMPATLCSLPQSALMTSQRAPHNQLTEEEPGRPGSGMVLHDLQTPLENCTALAPFWDSPEGRW